jgi:hypothetical protein
MVKEEFVFELAKEAIDFARECVEQGCSIDYVGSSWSTRKAGDFGVAVFIEQVLDF